MPKSKKPRKRHNPGKVLPSHHQFIQQKDLDALKSLFTKMELITEITLPTGKCKKEDVDAMGDFVNLGFTLLHFGNYIEPTLKTTADKEFADLFQSFSNLYERSERTGSMTCYASELNGIRDGMAVIGDIVREEFEREPAHVLDCYYGMNEYVFTEYTPGTKFDVEKLKRTIDRVKSQPIQLRRNLRNAKKGFHQSAHERAHV